MYEYWLAEVAGVVYRRRMVPERNTIPKAEVHGVWLMVQMQTEAGTVKVR